MSHTQLLIDYEAALATQDWDVVAPLIHQDACFIFSEGTYLGKPAIEQAFRRTFSLIKEETYQIAQLRWIHVASNSATCTYEFAWSGQIEGKPASGKGRGTTVVVCEAGVWRIIHEHLGPAAR